MRRLPEIVAGDTGEWLVPVRNPRYGNTTVRFARVKPPEQMLSEIVGATNELLDRGMELMARNQGNPMNLEVGKLLTDYARYVQEVVK